MLPNFRKSTGFLEVPRLSSFVPLVRQTCRSRWVWSIGAMTLTGDNRRTGIGTCPSATLSTIVPTWTDLGSNSGVRGEKPAWVMARPLYCNIKVQALRLCYKSSQLMLYREIIAVCSQIHTKHINTLCGQNVELLNVKPAVHIVTTGL